MNTTSLPPRAAGFLSVALAVASIGCTQAPLRQLTAETFQVPATRLVPGADFEPPRPLHVVQPVYPLDLKRRGISGHVYANCLVDETGRVQDARVIDASDQAFSQAALAALQSWTFTPAHRNGTPIAIRVSVPIKFELAD